MGRAGLCTVFRDISVITLNLNYEGINLMSQLYIHMLHCCTNCMPWYLTFSESLCCNGIVVVLRVETWRRIITPDTPWPKISKTSSCSLGPWPASVGRAWVVASPTGPCDGCSTGLVRELHNMKAVAWVWWWCHAEGSYVLMLPLPW
jgi:hypothetical protein